MNRDDMSVRSAIRSAIRRAAEAEASEMEKLKIKLNIKFDPFGQFGCKDLSLLRPFDLEAARAGELVRTVSDEETGRLVAESSDHCEFCIEWSSSGLELVRPFDLEFLRMVPLAWVEGKPVYKGDMLYRNDLEFPVSSGNGIYLFTSAEKRPQTPAPLPSELTWIKPEPKKVKKSAWVNIYRRTHSTGHICITHSTKDAADSHAGIRRIACVPIEWEE